MGLTDSAKLWWGRFEAQADIARPNRHPSRCSCLRYPAREFAQLLRTRRRLPSDRVFCPISSECRTTGGLQADLRSRRSLLVDQEPATQASASTAEQRATGRRCGRSCLPRRDAARCRSCPDAGHSGPGGRRDADSLALTSLSDLTGGTIAIKLGSRERPAAEQSGLPFVEINDRGQLFDMLDHRRVDAVLMRATHFVSTLDFAATIRRNSALSSSSARSGFITCSGPSTRISCPDWIGLLQRFRKPAKSRRRPSNGWHSRPHWRIPNPRGKATELRGEMAMLAVSRSRRGRSGSHSVATTTAAQRIDAPPCVKLGTCRWWCRCRDSRRLVSRQWNGRT